MEKAQASKEITPNKHFLQLFYKKTCYVCQKKVLLTPPKHTALALSSLKRALQTTCFSSVQNYSVGLTVGSV